MPSKIDQKIGNFCYDPYQNLAVKFNLSFLTELYFSFMNKIFHSAEILQLLPIVKFVPFSKPS